MYLKGSASLSVAALSERTPSCNFTLCRGNQDGPLGPAFGAILEFG